MTFPVNLSRATMKYLIIIPIFIFKIVFVFAQTSKPLNYTKITEANKNGYSIVKGNNGKYGIIDKSGNLKTESVFDTITCEAYNSWEPDYLSFLAKYKQPYPILNK